MWVLAHLLPLTASLYFCYLLALQSIKTQCSIAETRYGC